MLYSVCFAALGLLAASTAASSIAETCHWLNDSRRVSPKGAVWRRMGGDDCEILGQAFFVVNERQKYVGCFTAKSGCTSWLKYLRFGEGHRNNQSAEAARLNELVHHHIHSKELGLAFVGCQNTTLLARHIKMLNDPSFFKFTMTRHPFDRIVSGYHSIAVPCCQAMAKQGLTSANYTENACCVTDGEPEDITFSSFVKGLSKRKAPLSVNPHFKSVAYSCMHYRVPWDFVGETDRALDTDYVSHRLGFAQTFSAMTQAQNHGADWTEGRLHDGDSECSEYSKYLKQLKMTEMDAQLLQSFLANDMAVLGYTWDGLVTD